jgi:uncharacterized FlaG/YvyC family protein
MAVEDTERINAGVDPVESRPEYRARRSRPEASRDTVSSPASSVEDRSAELKKAESQDASIPSDNRVSRGGDASGAALSESKVAEINEAINQELSFFAHSIQFKIEEVEKKPEADAPADAPQVSIPKKEIVVQVVDKRTGEVIRKVPPEELLQSLNNASMFVGLLMDQIV